MQSPIERPRRNVIDLSDRVAIVTGAAGGLGQAATERLLQSGATVWVWDRASAPLEAACERWRGLGTVHPVVLDVTSSDDVQQAVERMGDRIDILLNVAGLDQIPTPLAETTLEDWQRLLAVNLTAPFLICRAIIPLMVRRGYGRIVNVSSIAGKEGSPKLAGYSASKAGLIGLTKSLGKELADTGIVVNGLAPVVFDTAMYRRTRDADPALMRDIMARIPMGRVGNVDEFAALASWMCSDECSFTTGFTFDLTGGRATY